MEVTDVLRSAFENSYATKAIKLQMYCQGNLDGQLFVKQLIHYV